jgi:hypothetical protein
LVEFMKLVTELTTPLAALATDAISPADGLDGSDLTALSSLLTDEEMALVSSGKSPLAWFTSVVASL